MIQIYFGIIYINLIYIVKKHNNLNNVVKSFQVNINKMYNNAMKNLFNSNEQVKIMIKTLNLKTNYIIINM